MNAIILMIPLLLIRFGLLNLLSKEAVSRAAFFAPLEGKERTALIFYQISNIFVILYPAFLKIDIEMPLFILGVIVYSIGIVFLTT